jgi:hypothetical protein
MKCTGIEFLASASRKSGDDRLLKRTKRRV